MKTRIVQMFCQTKCRDVLVVQKWLTREEIDKVQAQWAPYRSRPGLDGTTVDPGSSPIAEHWDSVRDFELDEFSRASAFASDLSITEKTQVEMAVFEEGKCVTENRGTTQ